MPEENFGDKLRNIRKKMSLRQDELANMVGVVTKTLQRWEYGETTPRADDIAKLCEALYVTESELLNGTSDETRELKLILDKEGEFIVQMFDMINMSSTTSDQRLMCVTKEKIATNLTITTMGMDKPTAKKVHGRH